MILHLDKACVLISVSSHENTYVSSADQGDKLFCRDNLFRYALYMKMMDEIEAKMA